MAGNAQAAFDLKVIGAGLPVARSLEQLEAALREGAAVVTAPPGTGKTTYVPPFVANLTGGTGRTIVTQPRRVAVRAAAARLASLDGSELGTRVGFTVRGERAVGAHTRIEVVTPGVLLRRLLADPGLDGVGAVVLDEIHERSLDSDLLLGMLAEVRTLREDLTLVAMSATLDASAVAGMLATDGEPAPIVDVPSVLHPLEIAYAPGNGARLGVRGVDRDYLHHLAAVTSREQQGTGGDVLVFVPGAREVDEVVRLLRDDSTLTGAEILPLHGGISPREQDRAVRGRTADTDPPRIVVSTALAESALTVPGVRLVVDSGLSREIRRDRARDMVGLVTVSASRSSVEQRAGRAARQGPGRAVRVYSETDFARMLTDAPPEIASADLLDAAMLLAAWGTPGGRGLALLTPPPALAMEQAERLLRTLHLIDDTGKLTADGTRVLRLPLGVREARALLAGQRRFQDPRTIAEIIAAAALDMRAPQADLATLLRELRVGGAPDTKRWRRETRRLERAMSEGHALNSGQDALNAASHDFSHAPGILVAYARPEWVARRVSPTSRSYLLASGSRAALPEGSPLVSEEWIAVREVQRADGHSADGTGAVIRLAAALPAQEAMLIAKSLITTTRTARIDDGRVRARETTALGAIVLSDTPVAATPGDVSAAFAAFIREEGIAALPWSEAATSLRGRLALLHRELGAPWPDVGDAALLETLDDWLGHELRGLKPQDGIDRLNVTSALHSLLPWPEAAQLDALVPERLSLPSGSTARIAYPEPGMPDGRPVVAAKLQELFGLLDSPRLVDGRVAVQFHLLSPARKPLAITDSLESFWAGPYQEVRREMRGRYPRHPWPEDPLTAEATAYTNRRLAQERERPKI